MRAFATLHALLHHVQRRMMQVEPAAMALSSDQ